jgi:hypothetical protein
MSTITGYKQDKEGHWIEKDRLAKLTYTLDWSQWLLTGVTISSVTYALTNPTYNPTVMVIESSGVQGGNTTYAVISGGTKSKIYTVTATVTLDNGQTDRRAFRIRVEDRQA